MPSAQHYLGLATALFFGSHFWPRTLERITQDSALVGWIIRDAFYTLILGVCSYRFFGAFSKGLFLGFHTWSELSCHVWLADIKAVISSTRTRLRPPAADADAPGPVESPATVSRPFSPPVLEASLGNSNDCRCLVERLLR